MLNAILAGKAGRIEVKSGENVSWKSLYLSREDLLTATVIERLGYLPTGLLFQLLLSAAVPKGVLPQSLGQLRELEFWPAFAHPDKDGSIVEPDVVLTFERGVLIIEAKAADYMMHSAQQWAQEWVAYHCEIISQNFPQLSQSPQNGEVYLVALGGIERDDVIGLERLTIQAQKLLEKNRFEAIPRLKAVGCAWSALSEAIRHERQSRANAWDESGLRMILRDLENAFKLHGFGPAMWIGQLADLPLHLPDKVLSDLVGAFKQGNEDLGESLKEWNVLCEFFSISANDIEIRRFMECLRI